jgi:hypothetical protein
LYLGLVLVYYFALEATIGQTVGKRLVGVRVVHGDGDRPSVGRVAIRTVVRLVDWLPLLYLVGFLTMLATGTRRQRLGDLAARTGIARAVPIRHRGLTAAAVASALVLVLAGSVVYVAASDEDGELRPTAAMVSRLTTRPNGAKQTRRSGRLSVPPPSGRLRSPPPTGTSSSSRPTG